MERRAGMPPVEEQTMRPERIADEAMVNDYMAHLRQVGFQPTPEDWRRLIPGISYADLSSHETAQKYGIKPLAIIQPDGHLVLDERCRALSPEQKQYILSHELGHRLVRELGRNIPEAHQQFQEVVAAIRQRGDLREISYYTATLEKTLKNKDRAEEKIDGEVAAELIAQYLASDGTFGGMIRQKLIHFPEVAGKLDAEQREHFEELTEEIGSVENYLNQADALTDSTQRDAFFEHHPKLASHYELWQMLRETLTDPELLQENPEQMSEFDFYLEAIWEDESLLGAFESPMMPHRPAPQPSAPKQAPTLGVNDIIHFWNFLA